MNTPQYKALIFDLGNVVFKYSYDEAYKYWSEITGKSFAEIKATFPFDHSFQDFECAKITPSQFLAEVNYRTGMSLSLEEFTKGWCSIYLDKCKDIDELLVTLKSRYRLISITNTNIVHDPGV